MNINDIIKKVSENQFILKEVGAPSDREFALTECTVNDYSKHFNIEFNRDRDRFIQLDTLLLVLIEFYGKEYLLELIEKLKSYDSIKDK